MTAAVVLRRLAETLQLHAEAVQWSKRQVDRGHYATGPEQALAAIADVVENQK